jgi:hypothetical protein
MRTILSLFLVLSSIITLTGQTTDLIISEYVEGSANNRAIEIFNGTGSAINLSNYRLERDLNGNNSFNYYCNLSGTLEHGQALVICNPNAWEVLKAKANILQQVITEFTGDDQLRLLKNDVEIDRIGVPGGVNFGQNITYIRKSNVLSPVSGNQDPRSNNQWDSHPADFFDNLGIHSIASSTQGVCGNAIQCDGFGNVAIGTSDTKGYKLAVKGKIVAEEIVVKLSSQWPDYVFSPSYSLLPLLEVEAHIQTHGHLPEVPNAQQVEENGIGLAEMNAILLKKVEELTLYSIEQEKEQEGMRTRIEELERQCQRVEDLEQLIKSVLNR